MTFPDENVPPLTGTVSGDSRKHLIATATARAVQFFDTECVTVTLFDQIADSITVNTAAMQPVLEHSSFTARYEATIHHQMQKPAYGFAECRVCRKRETP